MSRGKKQAGLVLQLALLFVLAVALRIPNLKADPPRLLADLSGSAGEFFDDGIYAHNARNKVLFGRWQTDEWNPFVYNAPLTGIYYLVFRFFGVSMAGVKLVNILFGALGVLFFFLLVRSWLAPGAALALTLLFSCDYYWLVYNRLGLLENFTALAFLLACCFFSLGRRRDWMFVLAGMTVALGVLSKYLYAFFLVAALLAVLHHSWQQRRIRPLLLFGAGFLALFLCWLVLIYVPFSASFRKIGASWGLQSFPHTVSQLLDNLLHQHWFRFLALMPLLGFAQILFFASFLTRVLRRLRQIDSLEVFVFSWLAGGLLTLGALQYGPMRYHLPLVPALFLAAALWLRHHEMAGADRIIFWPLLGILSLCFFPFFRSLLVFPSAFFVLPGPLQAAAYAGIFVMLFLMLFPLQLKIARPAIFVFCVVLLCSSFLYFRHFCRRPTYNLEMAASHMGSLPAGSMIMGQESLRLALDTPFPALMAYEGWFNDENPFEKFRPTHLLVLNRFGGREYAWIQRRFPGVAARLELLRNFWVWDSTVSLYKVNLPR